MWAATSSAPDDPTTRSPVERDRSFCARWLPRVYSTTAERLTRAVWPTLHINVARPGMCFQANCAVARVSFTFNGDSHPASTAASVTANGIASATKQVRLSMMPMQWRSSRPVYGRSVRSRARLRGTHSDHTSTPSKLAEEPQLRNPIRPDRNSVSLLPPSGWKLAPQSVETDTVIDAPTIDRRIR